MNLLQYAEYSFLALEEASVNNVLLPLLENRIGT